MIDFKHVLRATQNLKTIGQPDYIALEWGDQGCRMRMDLQDIPSVVLLGNELTHTNRLTLTNVTTFISSMVTFIEAKRLEAESTSDDCS